MQNQCSSEIKQFLFCFKEICWFRTRQITIAGTLKLIDHSEWVTSIFIVPKSNDSVKVCGSYRATVNAYIGNDKYPFPSDEELFVILYGLKLFTRFELKDAYFQQPVDDKIIKMLTVNAHTGLFSVHKLLYLYRVLYGWPKKNESVEFEPYFKGTSQLLVRKIL